MPNGILIGCSFFVAFFVSISEKENVNSKATEAIKLNGGKTMLNFDEFKEIEVTTKKSNPGLPALRVTRTRNTCRIVLNKELTKRLKLQADADGKSGIHVLTDGKKIYVGAFLREDIKEFRGKLEDGVLTVYSTPLAETFESFSGKEVALNKTLTFEHVKFDIGKDKSGKEIPVAVFSFGKQ